MSEEQKAIKKLEKITNDYTLNSEDLHYAIVLYHLIINLQQENKELHNKIDNAIEFINKAQYDDELKSYVYGLNATGTRKLLEILKDSDADE